jgi:integrase/recombinase XerD
MAKFNLNISNNPKESLIFWLTRYLHFKAITLNNSKADREKLQKALSKLRPTPDSFEKLQQIAREISLAGVGVYTQFYPAYLFCKENHSKIEKLEEIDTELVIEWLSIVTSSKRDATKLNYKNALINFFDYISKNNLQKYILDVELKFWQKSLKRSIEHPPAFLNENEIYRFLEILEQFEIKQKRKPYDVDIYQTTMFRLFFKLTLATGMRVSEVINLKMKDIQIDDKNDIIIISILNSKGNKSRIVTLPYSMGKFSIQKELNEYLKIRKCNEDCKNSFFCNRKQKCISRYSADYYLSTLLKSFGIKKEKMGMHLLRHSFASFFYKKTQDPVLLQERLGHSDPQVTRRYIHLEEEKLKKSADVMR